MTLGNENISGKFQNLIELLPIVQSSCRNENFVNTSKIIFENRIELFP